MYRIRSVKGKKHGHRFTDTLEEQFWDYTIELPNGCIQWLAGIDDGYYGQFCVGPGEKVYAHKYAWEIDRGPIPEGFQVDHTCLNPGCVNVEHMHLVMMNEALAQGADRTHPWENHFLEPAS